jgi:hypothetical protein
MGVATFTKRNEYPLGNSARLAVGTVAMSSSYATGGDTLDFEGDRVTGDSEVIVGTNGKIIARQDNAAAAAAALGEVAAATNLSTTVAECWVILAV